jgi:predicted Rossmann fold flavoprotein
MFHQALSGLSQNVTLTTVVGGKPVDVRSGSLLWTHFGVSGPAVMDASRFWTLARERGTRADVYANLLPDWTEEAARQWLITQAAANPRRSIAKILAVAVPERLAEAVCASQEVDAGQPSAQLRRGQRERLIAALTRLPLPVRTDRGWNYAEVTAGGIPLDEVNYRTMESKYVSRLYVIGEMLDCDGRIGGYNFQWAWATGYIAGSAAIASRT